MNFESEDRFGLRHLAGIVVLSGTLHSMSSVETGLATAILAVLGILLVMKDMGVVGNGDSVLSALMTHCFGEHFEEEE